MPTVFFKVTDTQEKEVKRFMKAEGYASKAEFFRFLVKFYKFKQDTPQKEWSPIADELGVTIKKLHRQGKLKGLSFDKQFSDV